MTTREGTPVAEQQVDEKKERRTVTKAIAKVKARLLAAQNEQDGNLQRVANCDVRIRELQGVLDDLDGNGNDDA